MAFQIEESLREADLAVQHAQEVRAYHRKRTERGDRQRETDIALALERVRLAMKPLRSEIGRFRHQESLPNLIERREKIRDASLALQRERRKLWKMQERTP